MSRIMGPVRVVAMMALLLSGCGTASYVVLEIDAAPEVRGAVNKLQVLIYSARDASGASFDGAVPLIGMWVPMQPAQDFPVTFGTRTAASTPERLVATVEGWLFTTGAAEEHTASTPAKEFSWKENDVTNIKMPDLVLLP